MLRLLLALLFFPAIVMAGDFRAAWVASVFNINFPSSPGISADRQKAQIIAILESAKRCHLNALLVQVRPESDALYASKIEPWSRYLTGTQGESPGYDPLAFFISEGKKRGIQIHAWLNPYRGAANASQACTQNHVTRQFLPYTYRIGSVLWMDPGAPAVQNHILAVVKDILQRYDVAGIHFDDYFYPYPTDSGKVYPFPDDHTYQDYLSGGGKLSKNDWRRENVNSLISRTSQLVHSTKMGAKFGVSPFGIYRPGVPAGTTAGVDQYGQLFGDPVLWLRQGWVDYLAPQLYWKDSGPQSFSALLRWWRSREINPGGIPIWPGVDVDRLIESGWASGEIGHQLSLEKQIEPRSRGGVIFWNMKALQNNTKGVAAIIGS